MIEALDSQKESFVCEMCGNYKMGSPRFLWIAFVTKQKALVCKKCAERESGQKKVRKLLDG